MGVAQDTPVAGDFEAFYARFRDPVLRAVFVASGDKEAAEDATAEAFVRACAKWRRVRKHPAPVAWVITTALNVIRSGKRRRRREEERGVPVTEEQAHNEPFDPCLLALVRELPVRQRQVLALRVLLDLSTEQTADALGIAAGTVTAHLHRALESLRTQLQDRTEEVEQ